MRPLPRMPNSRCGPCAGQIDEALERQAAGIDVVEHDGHQRLHAGHAGMRCRDRRGPSPRACAARGRSPARRRCPPASAGPDRLRDGARRAPAGSSARRCRAARSSRARPASDDAASPRRSPSPCGRRGTPSRRPSRRAARARAARASRRGAPGAAWRSAPPPRRARRGARTDRPGARRCMRSFSRASSSEWKAARRRDRCAMMRSSDGSSSTSRSPVEEPMNTLMPAEPSSRSSVGMSSMFSRVPPT